MKYQTFLAFFLLTTFLGAQQKPTQEWLDRKFSMFIHFGLYSVYGGVYDGQPVTRGYSEQIQSFAGIFSDWYASAANDFNPINWNPDSIVSLAKQAGMVSIVFTSKHHDGFCMYHSAHTDFNIVDATPYGRDLMKELSEACERGGIGFGVYFSLIDWHYPQAYPISSHNADPLTPEHYIFNLKQVEEIMTNYGPLTEIWFDMGSLTPEQSKGLYELVNRLQPKCMISGRLGNDYMDFAVMADNEYPDYHIGVPWQTAASMFDETWGYRSWQERGEVSSKVKEKIESLIKVVQRGGNYLLNIGPRGDGSVVEFEREVLIEMGQWVKNNRELIYSLQDNYPSEVVNNRDLTRQNAESLFGHSSINYYAGYKSVIGYDWTVSSKKRSVIPQISFTAQEMGRAVLLEIDGHQQALMLGMEMVVTKDGSVVEDEGILVSNKKIKQGSVQWGRLYRKPGRGVFGNVKEEGVRLIDVNAVGSDWSTVENFCYGDFYSERISPRESVLFLQEIESSIGQTVAVNIGCGNAMYLLLNGEYVTAHFSPERIEQQEEIVL